jgi:hypothetical protein
MNALMRSLAAVAFAVLLLSECASAQRRVFTNEDVETAPPPAAATPPAPTATESPASTAPSPAGAVDTSAARASGTTPQADLNGVKAIQASLKELYDIFAVKASQAPSADLEKRWTEMNDCMGQVIRANQLTIEEMQQSLGLPPDTPEAEPAAPPAQTPAAP